MVTLSKDAAEKIDNFIAQSLDTMDWFLLISWRKGPAENWRAADGMPVWELQPDEGWTAELGGYHPGKVPSDMGAPLYRGVRLLIQETPTPPEPFLGGEVYVEDGQFKVRAHAI